MILFHKGKPEILRGINALPEADELKRGTLLYIDGDWYRCGAANMPAPRGNSWWQLHEWQIPSTIRAWILLL